MKIKGLLAYTTGLFLLGACLNGIANITFNIASNFPENFYCHFKVSGWNDWREGVGQPKYEDGQWSRHYYAGSRYQESVDFEPDKIIASCFDKISSENIQSTGHICYSLEKAKNKNTVVNVTRSGSHVILSPMGDHCY